LGAAQWRFSQSSRSDLWRTPGLFEGYGIRTRSRLETFGAAAFGQLDWAITEKLHVLPGIRYNYDRKKVDFDRQTYGGLQTEDPALLALKRAVYTDQAFSADVDESNISGQLTVSYKVRSDINAFATYSLSYKPVGINLGGLPTSNGEVMIELARIKPESVTHYEVGLKTSPARNFIFNIVAHQTDIKDYQTQVQTAEVGVNRGYLANAEKVRVWGIESDANYKLNDHLTIYANLAYTEGKYLSFTNAPVPLEETGASTSFKNVSDGDLPGISKWAGSIGGEIQSALKKAFNKEGRYFLAIDNYFRSGFSSSPSPSKYLNVPGYALWFQCLFACAWSVSGQYGQLLDMISFVVVGFYMLTIAGIFILRKKRPDHPRPYKAFGYPVLPILYIVMGLSFCVLLIFFKPNYTWPGLIITLLGIPIYYAIRKNDSGQTR
ncbi:MAG: TonB-dependent receptor, partial [Flavihumibacter sp.]|nr:TonB-dependent receptor [Flavihumibacter sp.]